MTAPPAPKRLKAIACEVLYREACYCAAKSTNIVDLQFLTQGLHDLGSDKMRERLQQEIDAVDPAQYQAVLLAYALCNNGIVGLTARTIPLIVPRAHDCITLFLGSHQKYIDYFDSRPGTYFHTTGWIERDRTNLEPVSTDVHHQLGISRTYEQYVAQYGEENAKYLMETLGDMTKNYDRIAYIDMGIQEQLGYDQHAETEAAAKHWKFERIPGDLRILTQLFDGPWDRQFLVLEPGEHIVADYKGDIIRGATDP